MKLQDIYIRDPYILPYDGMYYMYGKKMIDELCFYVYKSKDLIEWSEGEKVFVPDSDFWADRDFWAPEVHFYNGKFYMFASFKSENHCRATQILVSDSPGGEFVPLTDKPVTPDDWDCLDGTLYIDKNGKPHIVFCHEWSQIGNGTVCEMTLSEDLKNAVSEPRELWKATDHKDVVDVFSDVESKVTDGPFFHRLKTDELICIWSSFNDNGYMELVARSDNGDMDGTWTIDEKPLSAQHGGHGMIFNTFDDKTMFVMHAPNDPPHERAVLFGLEEKGSEIMLSGKWRRS